MVTMAFSSILVELQFPLILEKGWSLKTSNTFWQESKGMLNGFPQAYITQSLRLGVRVIHSKQAHGRN